MRNILHLSHLDAGHPITLLLHCEGQGTDGIAWIYQVLKNACHLAPNFDTNGANLLSVREALSTQHACIKI